MAGKYNYNLQEAPNKTEAKTMKDYAVSLDVPRKKIFTEEKSLDTIGKAYFSKLFFFEQKKWNKIIIVTSDFHISRAMFLFKKVLGNKYNLKFVGTLSKLGGDQLKFTLMREEESLTKMKKVLDNIKPGDDASIAKFMYSKIDWYHKDNYNKLPQEIGTS